MSRRSNRTINLPAPYLKRIWLDPSQVHDREAYPFCLPTRGMNCPSLAVVTALESAEGAGKAGCRLAPAVRCARNALEADAQRHTGEAEHPAFPAQGKIKMPTHMRARRRTDHSIDISTFYAEIARSECVGAPSRAQTRSRHIARTGTQSWLAKSASALSKAAALAFA
ncbi:hypothetical protein ACVIQT_006292 [Bradyrhizobium diazoefficiens]